MQIYIWTCLCLQRPAYLRPWLNKSEWADHAVKGYIVREYSSTVLSARWATVDWSLAWKNTISTRPQSSQLVEPLWTDLCLERVDLNRARWSISNLEKKKKEKAGKWFVEPFPIILAREETDHSVCLIRNSKLSLWQLPVLVLDKNNKLGWFTVSRPTLFFFPQTLKYISKT